MQWVESKVINHSELWEIREILIRENGSNLTLSLILKKVKKVYIYIFSNGVELRKDAGITKLTKLELMLMRV